MFTETTSTAQSQPVPTASKLRIRQIRGQLTDARLRSLATQETPYK